MRVQIDRADDRRIGQMLIGLRNGWLAPVLVPSGSLVPAASAARPARAWRARRRPGSRTTPGAHSQCVAACGVLCLLPRRNDVRRQSGACDDEDGDESNDCVRRSAGEQHRLCRGDAEFSACRGRRHRSAGDVLQGGVRNAGSQSPRGPGWARDLRELWRDSGCRQGEPQRARRHHAPRFRRDEGPDRPRNLQRDRHEGHRRRHQGSGRNNGRRATGVQKHRDHDWYCHRSRGQPR